MTNAVIDIVLACYNGEQYISEQIRSIQNSYGYADLVHRFIICDDGSIDDTISVVKSLLKTDQKLELHYNKSGVSGASANFSYALSLTTSDYIVLADQDDIWHPQKLRKQHSLMVLQQPCLVFSDKQIVNDQLEQLCSSYFELKNISKDWHHDITNLAQQNVVSGCVSMVNRALLDLSMPISKDAYMHDWWLALHAKAFGHLRFIDESLIQYRQHSNNTIGAKKRSFTTLLTQLPKEFNLFERSVKQVIQQSQAFYSQLEIQASKGVAHSLTDGQYEKLNIIATIFEKPKRQRLIHWLKRDVTRSTIAARLALLIVLLK